MWPAEVPSGLDVRNLWDKQHLLEDIRIAEELDIRHRDSVLGRKVTSVFGIVVRMGGQDHRQSRRSRTRMCRFTV